MALGLLTSLSPVRADTIVVAATAPNSDDFVPLEHLALLWEDDKGQQRILVRSVWNETFPGFGVSAGDRFGNDGVVELSALWGPDGPRAVDLLVAAVPVPDEDFFIDDFGFLIPTPERLWVLAEDGTIAELRGIWGTDGAAIPSPDDWHPDPDEWHPDPDEWLVHDTEFLGQGWGAATTLAEGTRAFSNPPVELDNFRDPILAIGTDAGCVALVGFFYPDSNEWHPDPTSIFGNDLLHDQAFASWREVTCVR